MVQQVCRDVVDDDTANVNLTLAPTSLAEKRRHRERHGDVVESVDADVTVNLAFTGSATLGSDYTRTAAAITIVAVTPAAR